MKSDVYELPLFLSKEDIHGKLKDFLESIQYDQITGFRKLYNSNKAEFFTLINEMVLRGFKFIIESNLFPKVNFDSSDYLVCKEPGNTKFQQIDFDVLGIGAIINDFDINDDSFFDKIPLDGFVFFNPQIDRQYLKALFENSGFEIINNGRIENKLNINEQNNLDQNYISDYYFEPKFNMFKNYCTIKNYKTMEDINLDIIYSLKYERGFGEKKIQQILEIYQYWLTNGEKVGIKDIKSKKIDFTKYNFRIESLFKEPKYNRFLQFCNNQNIKLVSDLEDSVLFNFSKQYSVGKKKVDEVWQVLMELENKYTSENDVFIIDAYDKLISLELSVNEYFEIFNIDSNISVELYLSDLHNHKYTDLAKYCSFDLLHLLEKCLNGYPKIETIFNNAIDRVVMSKNTYKVVLLDRIEGNKTLEQVADELEITRERVRQISKNILKKINAILHKELFFSYLQLLFWDKQIIVRDDFIKVFPKHYATLISMIEEENTNLFWNTKFDFFSFSEIELLDPPILNEQREYYLAKDVINECIDYWGEIINDLDEKKVRKILIEVYGFHDYGEILTKYRLTKVKCIQILLQYYLTDGIKFDDNGCNIIKKMMFEKFGIDMYSDSTRTIEAKARTNGELILVGPKEFKYFQETPNIISLVEDIEIFIDKYFDTHDVIDSKFLFNVYKEKNIENDISNDFTLYSLIKKYCRDKYTFSKGNEMCIYKSSNVRVLREEQLKAIFNSNCIVMKKQEIIEHLLWPTSKLENVIGISKSFFCGSLSKIYCCDYVILNEEEISLLNLYYDRCRENDYCHLNKLFYELKFDPIFNKILQKYNIENGTDLGVLLKYVNGVRAWYYIAFSKESEKKNILDVLVSRFPNIVYRNEIVEYLKENKYDARQITFVFSSIENKNVFFNIDRECFVNSNSFSIEASAVNSLLDYIGNQEYILLNSLRGYRKQLPKINYKWTPILMAAVLSKNGYRIISKLNKDYRYDYSIVVKTDSKIESLADLVYKILINEYEGSHDVQSIINYMNERKVFYNKVLPYEILRDKRFNVDEFNILHWRY